MVDATITMLLPLLLLLLIIYCEIRVRFECFFYCENKIDPGYRAEPGAFVLTVCSAFASDFFKQKV